MAGRVRLGVDVGGTFTDLVALVDGRVLTAKVPSTPADQSVGVLAAVDVSGVDPGAVAVFAHGMTVATNALLERRGGRTALVTTAGFRDVIEIGRQNRPALYDLAADRPPTLVPRELRFTVAERMGPAGVLVPLADAETERLVGALAAAEVEAVAVCLIFGFLHPAHERAIGAAIRAALPGLPVSLSCELLPEFREYERTATVAADAYLAPRVQAYLRRLAGRAAERGLPEPLVMQSTGGVAGVEVAAAQPARVVLSGPAGGVVGASAVAARSGYRDLLTFDMGGTSTDVAAVDGGAVQTTTESVLAGVPVKLPAVDVHTVSAGGGSVAWADAGGALRVGPHSAGAEPGPAAYGLGGTEPTVTDADLVLGLLPPGARLGGAVTLSVDLARAALARLGDRLGLTVQEAALGVARVADTEMVRALRVISVQRGLHPGDFALVAFGGAGGMHACALAEELGIRTVLVPRAGGVLSALGLAISELRRDYAAPLLGTVDALDPAALTAAWDDLAARARADLAPAGTPGTTDPDRATDPHHPADPDHPAGTADGAGLRLVRLADLRYRGQSYELTVGGTDPAGLAEAFHAAHQQRYGHRAEDEPVEIVAVRLVATLPGEQPEIVEPDPPDPAPPPGRRDVLLDGSPADGPVDGPSGRWSTVDVYDRAALGRGSRLAGPAVIEFAESTCLVRPGWSGHVDGVGTLVLRRG
ncbi:MAG: N-methylhydantoinase [Mycobacteriales bacterium]